VTSPWRTCGAERCGLSGLGLVRSL
jgi:hypothetical protein